MQESLCHTPNQCRARCCCCCCCCSGHLGVEPSSTQLAHLLKEARGAGEFVPYPQLALRYTQLAAERGIKGAASALSHAYATGVLTNECIQQYVCVCVCVCRHWEYLGTWVCVYVGGGAHGGAGEFVPDLGCWPCATHSWLRSGVSRGCISAQPRVRHRCVHAVVCVSGEWGVCFYVCVHKYPLC